MKINNLHLKQFNTLGIAAISEHNDIANNYQPSGNDAILRDTNPR